MLPKVLSSLHSHSVTSSAAQDDAFIYALVDNINTRAVKART